jgi:hypothetical protein
MRVEGEVLPGALKASFATLSPTQGYAAIGTMPHTLASVDQSPVRRPRTLPLRNEDAYGWIFRVIWGKQSPSMWDIPDDGGSTHLWNVGRQSIYTAVQPRRQLWTSVTV